MAPSPKRRKHGSPTSMHPLNEDKDDIAAASTRPAQLSSFKKFALLPHEVQSLIVTLACSAEQTSWSSSASAAASDVSSASSSATYSDVGRWSRSALPRIDAATALSLSLVSRSMYALLAPLIWRRAWLTHSSQVASFQQALAARPQLGRLVKSLHIGPDDDLPASTYPLGGQQGSIDSDSDSDGDAAEPPITTAITSSLGQRNEASLLPQWCEPDKRWCLEKRANDCGPRAVYDALCEIQRALDVDLVEAGKTTSGQALPLLDWTARMYEAQAALDLYLMALKDIDDEHAKVDSPSSLRCHCPRGSCPVYPALALTATSLTAETTGRKLHAKVIQPVQLTRYQLLRHLARPGSITDRLDHLLLFARSGIDMVIRASHLRSRRISRSRNAESGQSEDVADSFLPAGRLGKYGISQVATSEVLDLSLPNTATLGSLLGLTRSILALMPLLANLSLTGFLEGAVCGSKAVELGNVRHLSIGPPPAGWFAPLRFNNVLRLETLGISGVELCQEEAFDVAHHLKSLSYFQYSAAAKWSDVVADRPFSCALPEIVRLLKREQPSTRRTDDECARKVDEHAQLEKLGDTENSVDEAQSANVASSPDEAPPPLLELRLHPQDAQSLLDTAPSESARAAWQSGKAYQVCRLLLVESAAAAHATWSDTACTSNAELCAEGKEWWDRCAGLREGA